MDSEDLPLNISRETQQQDPARDQEELVKKCLEMFAEIADKKDDYKKFYKQFGKPLKLGAHKPEKTVKDLIWLLRTSGFNLDESTKFAGRVQRMIKLGWVMTICHLRRSRELRMRLPRWRSLTKLQPEEFARANDNRDLTRRERSVTLL